MEENGTVLYRKAFDMALRPDKSLTTVLPWAYDPTEYENSGNTGLIQSLIIDLSKRDFSGRSDSLGTRPILEKIVSRCAKIFINASIPTDEMKDLQIWEVFPETFL